MARKSDANAPPHGGGPALEDGPSIGILTEEGRKEVERAMRERPENALPRVEEWSKADLHEMLPKEYARHIDALDARDAHRWDFLFARRFALQHNQPLHHQPAQWSDAPHAAHIAELLTSLASSSDELAMGMRYATARRIIDDATEEHPEARKASGALEALEKELAKSLLELVALWATNGTVTKDDGSKRPRYVCEEDTEEEDGMLALDARYVRYLDGLSSAGKVIAENVRQARTKLWRDVNDANVWAEWSEKLSKLVPMDRQAYLPDYDAAFAEIGLPPIPIRLLQFWHPAPGAPKPVRNLALALWRDVVGPRLEEAFRKPPSLVRAVHVDTMHFHSRAPRYDEKSSSLTFEGRKLAEHIGATFDIDVIQRGLGLLGSVVSHELFHWEVTQGHEQHLRGAARPHVLNVEGGWVALAERLGLKPAKHATNLRALVIAQAAFHFSFPDGSRGNMLILNERPAVGGRRGNVRIELGSVLMPGYVHGLPPREKKLVPLLRERVPLYGRSNEHGEQRTMSLAIMAEFRDRARELVEEGGVRLSQDDFTSLADRSGLPRKLIVPVRDHWLQGDTRAPAFLKRIERDRYTLSDVHAAERAFLEDGGRDELTGHAAGVKGAANKRAKIRRLGRGKTATKPR